MGAGHLVGHLLAGDITEDQQNALERAANRSLDEIRLCLGASEEDGSSQEGSDEATDVPSIICTSLVGAKGLSAGYVYVVGFNNQDFPGRPDAITDNEVCCFIVALSRARKECHLVSCGRYAGDPREPSVFWGMG